LSSEDFKDKVIFRMTLCLLSSCWIILTDENGNEYFYNTAVDKAAFFKNLTDESKNEIENQKSGVKFKNVKASFYLQVHYAEMIEEEEYFFTVSVDVENKMVIKHRSGTSKKKTNLPLWNEVVG